MQSETTYVLTLESIENVLEQLNVADRSDDGDVKFLTVGSTLHVTRLLRKKVLVETAVSVIGHLPFPLQIKWRRLKQFLSGHSNKVLVVLSINSKGLGSLRIDNMLVDFEPLTQQFSLPFDGTTAMDEKQHKLLERIAQIDAENLLTGSICVEALASRYERDKELVTLIKLLRGSRCQICKFSFKTIAGEDYSECHHLENLANNGLDVSKNILVLCANHHRQFHYGSIQIIKHAENSIDILIEGVIHQCTL